MARLASAAKLGYYPTPENVCNKIRSMLEFEDGVKALDPCCGDGTALELITAGANVVRYGIELDDDRYHKAAEKLDHVLHGDALREVRVSGRFDLLFLNPPYDWEDGERLETKFLRKYAPCVAADGWIIHVVPFYVPISYQENYYHRFLIDFSKELYIFRFPDEQFGDFEQIVIFQRFGRAKEEQRGRNKLIMSEISQRLSRLWNDAKDAFDPIDKADLKLKVEVKNRKISRFESEHVTTAQYEAASRTVNVADSLKHFSIPSVIDTTPLAPLRNGHLAMLVTSGMVNGLKIDLPDGFMVIKGVVTRETVVVQDDEDQAVTIKRPQMTVKVLFVRDGAFMVTTLF